MRVTSVTTLCLAFAASGAVHAVPLHHGAEAFASRRDGSSDPALSSTADGSGAFSLSGLFDLIPDIVPLIGDIFGSGATSSGNNTRRDDIVHPRNTGVDNVHALLASLATAASSNAGNSTVSASDSSDGSSGDNIIDDILGLLPDVIPLLFKREADVHKRDFLEDLVSALASLLDGDTTSQKREILQLWARKGAPKISAPKKAPVSPPQKPPTTPKPPPPPPTPKVAPATIIKPTTAATEPPVTPSAPPVTTPTRPSTTPASKVVTEVSESELTTPSAPPSSVPVITTSQAPSTVTSASAVTQTSTPTSPSAVATSASSAPGDGSDRDDDDDSSTSDGGVSFPDAVSGVTGLVGVFTGLFPPATATVDASPADATPVVNNGNNITVSPDITVNLPGAASAVLSTLATSTAVLQPSAVANLTANSTTPVSSSIAETLTSSLPTNAATAAPSGPSGPAITSPVGLTDIL